MQYVRQIMSGWGETSNRWFKVLRHAGLADLVQVTERDSTWATWALQYVRRFLPCTTLDC